MLTIVPDILCEYRRSLSEQFSLFNNDSACPSSDGRDFPIYDMWKGRSPPSIKNIFDASDSSSEAISPSSSVVFDTSSDDSPGSTPSPTDSSREDSCVEGDFSIPTMENIVTFKRLNLTPSGFTNGCICGHHVEFRDMVYETRKRRNTRCPGVTIRPKTPPIIIKLRSSS